MTSASIDKARRHQGWAGELAHGSSSSVGALARGWHLLVALPSHELGLREVLGHWWRAPCQLYCKLCMGTDGHYTFFVVSIFEMYRIAKSRYWTPEANAISHVGCPLVNNRKRESLGSGARQTWIQNPSLPRVSCVGLSCDATKLALVERILVVPSDGKTGGQWMNYVYNMLGTMPGILDALWVWGSPWDHTVRALSWTWPWNLVEPCRSVGAFLTWVPRAWGKPDCVRNSFSKALRHVPDITFSFCHLGGRSMAVFSNPCLLEAASVVFSPSGCLYSEGHYCLGSNISHFQFLQFSCRVNLLLCSF